jgi:hypothetical protein
MKIRLTEQQLKTLNETVEVSTIDDQIDYLVNIKRSRFLYGTMSSEIAILNEIIHNLKRLKKMELIN